MDDGIDERTPRVESDTSKRNSERERSRDMPVPVDHERSLCFPDLAFKSSDSVSLRFFTYSRRIPAAASAL